MSLFVRPAAAGDLEEAFRWYESQRSGLGDEFLGAIRLAFEAITEQPTSRPTIYRDLRRVAAKRFPYVIYYRAVGPDVIVVACMHGSRAPRRWQRRR